MNDVGVARPRVLIVGGPDVDQRLELMRRLHGSFELVAAGSDPARSASFESEGFRFHSYHLHRGANPADDVRSFFALRRIVARERPDIVHAFATKPSVWGRLAAATLDVPVIVGTLPGLGSLYTDSGRRSRIVRWTYEWLQTAACRASHMTLFQNRHDLEEFVGRGVASAQQSRVIPGSGVQTDFYAPDAVDVSEIRSLREEIGVSESDVVVTMVSRLIRAKGVEEFAAAAGLVRDVHPNVRFVLVGPEDPDSLDALPVDVLGSVRKQVTWLGERDDVRLILAASQICALPTYYREGMPRVLLEAASMGLPLVTTRSPGCADVVEDGVNGLLVGTRAPGELAAAVGRLARDPELRRRLGSASRARACSEFDAGVIAANTRDLYMRLLSTRSSRFERAENGEVAIS